MAVKQPVSIEGIEFDARLNEEYSMEAESPEYVVESGYTISDSIILKAENLNLTLFVSDMPVTFRDRFGSGNGRVEKVVQELKDLYHAKKLVSVTTPDGQYDNMAIQSLTISRTNEYGYAKEIPIALKHVRITETQTTTIPASYGKSGTTKKAAGTAGTKKASSSKGKSSKSKSSGKGSAGGSGSSASSGGGSSSGSKSSSNSKGSSVLYNLASGVGLI